MIGTSIAASALPKAALAITLSLHPAAAHHAQYTVKSGDTLASIAKHEYGSADRWPALWWVNRSAVRNPEDLGRPATGGGSEPRTESRLITDPEAFLTKPGCLLSSTRGKRHRPRVRCTEAHG